MESLDFTASPEIADCQVIDKVVQASLHPRIYIIGKSKWKLTSTYLAETSENFMQQFITGYMYTGNNIENKQGRGVLCQVGDKTNCGVYLQHLSSARNERQNKL